MSQYGLSLPPPGVEFTPDSRFVLRLPTLGGRLVLQLRKNPFLSLPAAKDACRMRHYIERERAEEAAAQSFELMSSRACKIY